MKDTDYSKSSIKPTLNTFAPYKQTVVGFFVVVIVVLCYQSYQADAVAESKLYQSASGQKPKLPSPIICSYGFPLSYDKGHNKQIPPIKAIDTKNEGGSPNYYNWNMKTPNVITFSGRIEKEEDVNKLYNYWHKRGKVLLINSTAKITFKADKNPVTEDKIFEEYSLSISKPWVDGISIDEYLLRRLETMPERMEPVIGALKRLRATYPDKIISVWITGWPSDWSNPLLKKFLLTLRDYTDLIKAEIYYKETHAPDFQFPRFKDLIVNMEKVAPGISKKTIIGIYLLQHPPKADNDPNVDFEVFLEKQVEWIKNDSLLRELPGIAFFAPYRAYEDTLIHFDGILKKYYFPARKPLIK